MIAASRAPAAAGTGDWATAAIECRLADADGAAHPRLSRAMSVVLRSRAGGRSRLPRGCEPATMTRMPLTGRSCAASMPTGGRRTTSPSARSTCSTTRCCASRCALEHVKPRLLGHWGTTPGLNFVYAHLNRLIVARDLQVLYVAGPGPRRPRRWSPTPTWRAATASCTRTSGAGEEGLRRLFRQFSFPGGIPSHVAPQTPGSIHEGGELGYSLAHAFGAAFDNPDLLVCCVVGDGEAETGPLAASWHSNKFLDAARDGAVLPILHLNGYKIANPTVLARIPEAELRALLEGYGYAPHFVAGSDPAEMHQRMAADARRGRRRDRRASRTPRATAAPTGRPRWPMIVLRTPKGWTGPKMVDGLPAEGTARSHQVPLANLAGNPEHLAQLEDWMRSYRPEELFDEHGGAARRSSPRSRRAASGAWARSRTPTAGCSPATSSCPTSAPTPSTCPRPARTSSEATRVLGVLPARRAARERGLPRTSGSSGPTRPRRTA